MHPVVTIETKRENFISSHERKEHERHRPNAEEVHAKETIKAKKAMAKEWLQLKYPHRQWVYNVNSHKTASFMLLKPKNELFTLATDFWIPEDDSR